MFFIKLKKFPSILRLMSSYHEWVFVLSNSFYAVDMVM
jgi:hypothetical protein